MPFDLSSLPTDLVDALRLLSCLDGDFDLLKLVVEVVSLFVSSLFLFIELFGLTGLLGLASFFTCLLSLEGYGALLGAGVVAEVAVD